MIKRKKIKYMYIEEAYCDKCGSKLEPTGAVLTSWPEQFPYVCSNKDCDFSTTFVGSDRPGMLKYEFEREIEPIEQTTKKCPKCKSAFLKLTHIHSDLDYYFCPACDEVFDV